MYETFPVIIKVEGTNKFQQTYCQSCYQFQYLEVITSTSTKCQC